VTRITAHPTLYCFGVTAPFFFGGAFSSPKLRATERWPSFFTGKRSPARPLYNHAQMLGQAMIQRDQLELLLAAVAGAGLGGITGIVLGHEELGTLIWALVGAVVVSGVVYLHRFFGRR
jgi:hypothetical protein